MAGRFRQTIVEAAGLLLLSKWTALSFMLVLDFGFGFGGRAANDNINTFSRQTHLSSYLMLLHLNIVELAVPLKFELDDRVPGIDRVRYWMRPAPPEGG